MTSFQHRCLDITRRHFLRDCGVGVGKMALAGLLADQLGAQARAAGIVVNPMAPRPPQFAPTAKAFITLFMAGAPSHLDLFDPKPELTKMDGKPLPLTLNVALHIGTTLSVLIYFWRDWMKIIVALWRRVTRGERSFEADTLSPRKFLRISILNFMWIGQAAYHPECGNH
jgi:hypothetical protein